MKPTADPTASAPNVFGVLRNYKGLILGLIALSLLANGFTLWLPRVMSHGIDGFLRGDSLNPILWRFGIGAGLIFIFTYLQTFVQTYASERVARDMRMQVSEKIATQTYAQVQALTPAKLLTNLTSDIDAVKNFVAQAIVNIASSLFLILGASVLLVAINWKLGLVVLLSIPIIAGTFFVILGKVRTLFLQSREVIDGLNTVINESIIGAALIRVLHSQRLEHEKFGAVNGRARDIGVAILKLFSAMIPVITFTANLATLAILVLGGKYVIGGSLSIGDFVSFNSYLVILIFPILLIGFMSTLIAQAQASFGRITEVLASPELQDVGTRRVTLSGSLQVQNVSLELAQKSVLRDVSFRVEPGSRVAIVGPTAAGKTQLLHVLIGLVQPTAGIVLYGRVDVREYERESLYKQVGLVFQDSVVFNISLRENIAFNTAVSVADLERAVHTAELADFVATLPEGLDTIVSERGTSLSGGQKQRIMLARALAINPKILLLDDFTARVDVATEQKIIANIAQNYPGLTLVSVTQKLAAVEDYDQIIVLMEGEVIATGTHSALLASSPEYVQIYNSQQTTNTHAI